ncbi:hypothetical protein GGR55DRAFT_670834, partial [Xylaria sp. FL0064]
MSEASSKKRRASNLDLTVVVNSLPLSPAQPAQPPSKRRRQNSPTKTNPKDILKLFEKPVYVKSIPMKDALFPKDIKSLFKKLQQTKFKQKVIPHEVRDKVVNMVGDVTPSFCFREEATPDANAIHTALCDIILEAQLAEEDNYQETGWNHLVHTPLLKLVYSSRFSGLPIPQQDNSKENPQPEAEPKAQTQPQPEAPPKAQPQPQTSVNVRMVPVMSATIFNRYIPTIKTPSGGPSAFAVTSSETGSEMQGYTPSEYPGTDPYSEVFTRSEKSNREDSKKVDYVLAIDPLDNTPLQKVISAYVLDEAFHQIRSPHVNQTLYSPLRQSPIACSIETKIEFQAQDPLLQLGTWIAAWHKRMLYLRKYITTFRLLSDDGVHSIPSTLLIKVANHEWQLYFACDDSQSISLYGPLSLGSTQELPALYGLVASLQVIKEWAETDFREGMEQWLMCDKVVL